MLLARAGAVCETSERVLRIIMYTTRIFGEKKIPRAKRIIITDEFRIESELIPSFDGSDPLKIPRIDAY